MKTIIVIPERVPGLNGKDGLIRENRWDAKKRKDRYLIYCLSQKKGRHKGIVTVKAVRHSIKLMDWENLWSSFKHIMDAIVYANIIRDDAPDIIINFSVSQEKISKMIDKKSVVIIEDYEE